MTNLNLSGIPEYMHGGVVRYVENGITPGSFLTAIFANDFMEACRRADDINSSCLFGYGRLLHSAPIGCHGSPEAVRDWIAHGGLHGLEQKAEAS